MTERAYTDISDEDLLVLTRNSELEAFDALVDRYLDSLLVTVFREVGDMTTAENLVHNIFEEAFQGAATLLKQQSMRTWLFKIVFQHIGRSQRINSESLLGLEKALATLVPEHRHVLVLREREDFSYEEISIILGIPTTAVQSALISARLELLKHCSTKQNQLTDKQNSVSKTRV